MLGLNPKLVFVAWYGLQGLLSPTLDWMGPLQTALLLVAIFMGRGWTRWLAGASIPVSLFLWHQGFSPGTFWLAVSAILYLCWPRRNWSRLGLLLVAPLFTLGLLFLEIGTRSWANKRPATLWLFFLPPLLTFIVLVRGPGNDGIGHFPGLLALILIQLAYWILSRTINLLDDGIPHRVLAMIAVLQLLPGPVPSFHRAVAWVLFASLLVGIQGLRFLASPMIWRPALGWLGFVFFTSITVTFAFWLHTAFQATFCSQANSMMSSTRVRALHMFPVSALAEARWTPAAPRFWKLSNRCWQTDNLPGQFATFVWKVRRKSECTYPSTWSVTVSDVKMRRRLQVFSFPFCLWPVTHPTLTTLTHIVPSAFKTDSAWKRRIEICYEGPKDYPGELLEAELVEVQRAIPLLFVQNLQVFTRDSRTVLFRARLLNNRRSILEGTLVLGLIHPTLNPPFRWLVNGTKELHIPAEQAVDLDFILPTDGWCGPAVWGMAFYHDNGESGFLWDASL